MPLDHLHVGLTGQTLLGQNGRERCVVGRVDEVEALHRDLQEGDMLLGLEQQLDRLPSHEAGRGQGWDGGRGVGILFGLQGVVAAEGLVDEGEGGLRGLEEERVVVPADETVEGCELGGGQSLGVPGRDVFILASPID